MYVISDGLGDPTPLGCRIPHPQATGYINDTRALAHAPAYAAAQLQGPPPIISHRALCACIQYCSQGITVCDPKLRSTA